ncbi:MAG TPA: YbaN family protein [Syntrophomonas sp.]|nr:YbaN family protein [Syntrophomonas sp.]
MTIKSRLLIILGFLLLGVGAIGIFLPVLPTTPFVLAAAVCFSGSPRLTAWLRKSRLFSDYITNYQERNGLSRRTVLTSLAFLWIMLGISVAVIKALWAAILMPCIGLAVTIHILCIARPKNKNSQL